MRAVVLVLSESRERRLDDARYDLWQPRLRRGYGLPEGDCDDGRLVTTELVVLPSGGARGRCNGARRGSRSDRHEARPHGIPIGRPADVTPPMRRLRADAI